MTEDRFRVVPEELEATSRALSGRADELARKVDTFSAQAGNIADAFGRLPQSDRTRTEYTRMLGRTLTELRKVTEWAEGASRGMQANAQNYRDADSINRSLMDSIRGRL